jgi:hypothetical protein
MDRLKKCEILKDKGYTYNPETGKIYGIYGKEITCKSQGYINLVSIGNFKKLYGHHFAYFMIYGNVDFIELDHINTIKTDNRISNLRISNRFQQSQNRDAKGYYWIERNKKWKSSITVNRKQIHLGYFNTEEEARQAYISAKSVYHRLI